MAKTRLVILNWLALSFGQKHRIFEGNFILSILDTIILLSYMPQPLHCSCLSYHHQTFILLLFHRKTLIQTSVLSSLSFLISKKSWADTSLSSQEVTYLLVISLMCCTRVPDPLRCSSKVFGHLPFKIPAGNPSRAEFLSPPTRWKANSTVSNSKESVQYFTACNCQDSVFLCKSVGLRPWNMIRIWWLGLRKRVFHGIKGVLKINFFSSLLAKI